jgi:hypothetical protein
MTLAFNIDEQIELAYLERGWRLFFPEQFEIEGATEREVVGALMALTKAGKLVATCERRCNEGHTVWSADLPRKPPKTIECHECEEPGNTETDTFVHFALATEWIAKLEEKKSPRSGTRSPRSTRR